MTPANNDAAQTVDPAIQAEQLRIALEALRSFMHEKVEKPVDFAIETINKIYALSTQVPTRAKSAVALDEHTKEKIRWATRVARGFAELDYNEPVGRNTSEAISLSYQLADLLEEDLSSIVGYDVMGEGARNGKRYNPHGEQYASLMAVAKLVQNYSAREAQGEIFPSEETDLDGLIMRALAGIGTQATIERHLMTVVMHNGKVSAAYGRRKQAEVYASGFSTSKDLTLKDGTFIPHQS
jgi:hypothetical protein